MTEQSFQNRIIFQRNNSEFKHLNGFNLLKNKIIKSHLNDTFVILA